MNHLKNHWKSIVIILLIILVIGLVFYYNVLPKYVEFGKEQGYNEALNDLANNKAVPLFVTQGNETIITTIKICIPEFIENYQAICEN